MLPNPTVAPTPIGSAAIASTALKKAGLMDKDSHMKDLTDRPGGRKGMTKTRNQHRPRPAAAYKDEGPAAAASRSRNMLSRISAHSGPSDPLSIRGASRPTAVGKLRRGAMSGTTQTNTSRPFTSIQPWKELVNKRWNKDAATLNLNALVDDEIAKKHQLKTPGAGGGGSREASIIFKLAKQLEPEVKTLDLGNNGLEGAHIATVAYYLPRIENLNLSHNKISKSDVEFVSGRKDKLVHLKELLLIGNPVQEKDFAASGVAQYRREVSRRFPSLIMLDQDPITSISFDAPPAATTSNVHVKKPTATTFPVDMGPSFIAGVDASLISNFLVRFFQLFDTQRASLALVYHPAATFSYSCNTSIPERARIRGFHRSLPNQTKLSWSELLNSGDMGSRNLSRLGATLDKQVQRLPVGGDAIAQRIAGLAGTQHDLSKSADMFSLDCFPVPHAGQMALMAVVHGQFVELPSEGIRSFDRTFILLPAADGSRAKMNGWDVEILSDCWTIRNYSHHEAWQPGPIYVGAAPKKKPVQSSITLPAEQQTALQAVADPKQRELILQVCGRTALTVKYAFDCLQLNAWDLDRAIANFHDVRGSLPRDAFLS